MPVSFHIGSHIYNSIDPTQMQTTFVHYFENGVRVSKNQAQKKIIRYRSNGLIILGTFHNPIIIPIMRTVATEINLPHPPQMETTTQINQRIILFQHDKIRLSLEFRSTKIGMNFWIVGEIEYTAEDRSNYNTLKMREYNLYHKLKTTLDAIFKDDPSVVMSEIFSAKYTTSMNIADLFKMPCRKFEKFHKKLIKDPSSVIVKHKYDGFKAKIVCIEPNLLLYVDDMNCFKSINSSIFNRMHNVVFQLENMCTTGCTSGCTSDSNETRSETIPVLIITDILGIKMGDNYYMPDPQDVIQFLSSFSGKKHYINFGDGAKKILVQSSVSIKSKSSFPTDGYILIYENMEFKYKIPTFDVKISNKKCYAKNNNNVDVSINGCVYNNYEDGIYEVTFNDFSVISDKLCNDLKFLRRRMDRIIPSTLSEIEEMKREFNIIRYWGCTL